MARPTHDPAWWLKWAWYWLVITALSFACTWQNPPWEEM